MKRCHYTSLAISRPLAAKFGLTPARFDLLHVIRRPPMRSCQADISRSLAVSPVTVCRMLKRLESLGLIRREPDVLDRRRMMVRLTKAGRRVYVLVARKLARRSLDRIFRAGLADASAWTTRCLQWWLPEMTRHFQRFVRRFGNGGSVSYPTWYRLPWELRPGL